MSRYLNLLGAARDVVAPEVEGHEALLDLLFNCLDTILLLEGPPEDPIEGVSTDHHAGFIFKGQKRIHPVAYGRTWVTGPWRCLFIETPSISMSRPIPFEQKRKASTTGADVTEAADTEDKKKDFWMPIDWPSQRFQRTVKAACEDFGIAVPMSAAAVHGVYHNTRSFIAWRHRETTERYSTNVRGDVDNYLKNTLDALQSARILVNDRGVFRATGSKEEPASWLMSAPPALATRLQQEALRLHKDKGLSPVEVRSELHLTHKQTLEIFPGYRHGKDLSDAPNLTIGGGLGKKRAARGSVDRAVARVLGGESQEEVVVEEGVKLTSLLAKLRLESGPGRPRATKEAMNQAVELVLAGEPPRVAAETAKVTLPGLKSRLKREGVEVSKPKSKGTKKGKKGAKTNAALKKARTQRKKSS